MDTGGKTENSGRNAEKGKAKSVGTPSSVSSKEKKPGYPWLEVPAKRISVRGSNPGQWLHRVGRRELFPREWM